MNFEEMTSAKLSEELKKIGLPSSGNKSEKIARLQEALVQKVDTSKGENGELILEAEYDDGGIVKRLMRERILLGKRVPAAGAVGMVLILLLSSMTALVAGPAIMNLIQGEPEYTLIDFEPSNARATAEHLVSLGHPVWEGRMSGTQEELQTAESNKQNFSDFGLSATLEEFDVPMFEIQAEPRVFYCVPGDYPLGIPLDILPCGPQDTNAQRVEFQHRFDFVIQGYSGTGNYQFGDDLQIVNLSNGTDDTLWSMATGEVGMVWGSTGVGSNTDIYAKAIQNDLAALFLVNAQYNCGKVEADDCVPIFKTVDVEGLLSQTGGNLPETIPFIQLSRSMGEELEGVFSEQDTNEAMLAMEVDVDNQGTRTVRVPCGILEGDDDRVIMFGAHHDTVYSGPGAVDDTSGTATVIELARQFAEMGKTLGTPKHTVKFCTWGGEEEGLHGSKAWVDKHAERLRENLIVYINLDMNHVDADPARGNDITLFGNYQSDVDHIERIVTKLQTDMPEMANKYDIRIRTLDGPKNSETGMPYNSDHGPFVYDIVHEDSDKPGHALVCYGSGSWEYHTYADDMSRFNEESLAVSAIVYGTYARYLAWGEI